MSRRKGHHVLALTWLLVLAIAAGCGGPTTTQVPAGQDLKQKPTEYKLAVIDAGEMIPENDPSVARFRELLDALERDTGESADRLADITVSTRNNLREQYGQSVSLLELMEQGQSVVETSKQSGLPVDYAEIMALVVAAHVPVTPEQ